MNKLRRFVGGHFLWGRPTGAALRISIYRHDFGFSSRRQDAGGVIARYAKRAEGRAFARLDCVLSI